MDAKYPFFTEPYAERSFDILDMYFLATQVTLCVNFNFYFFNAQYKSSIKSSHFSQISFAHSQRFECVLGGKQYQC